MKKWQIRPLDQEKVSLFSEKAKIPPLIAKILLNRGINDLSQAETYLNPNLKYLKDPFDIPNIRLAAERVLLAKKRGEKVLVYGDYDVDGVTGTVILVQTLKMLGIDALYYIPNRYGEGYSLSLESVKKVAESGTNLIITVDCGISSAIEIEEAAALGMDVIVTDHHNLPKILPKACAIVNPKQIAEEHPSKYLSGAGVAFKFAWAILRTADIKDSQFLISLLDAAALGTFSDVVPLTAENRILAVNGLKSINERKRPGLKSLMEAASLKGNITTNQIYFGLAPRLNAAGRIEHASKAVELLLAKDEEQAGPLAQELNAINVRRKDIGASIKEEVYSRLDDKYVSENKLILLSGENWHPGVIGIVASRVAEDFNRPTVLIGINEGVGRGSARSISGINIYDLLDACHDLFLDFGGHEGAAGFEIEPDKIDLLRQRLMEAVEILLKPEDLIPIFEIDAEIEPSEINLGMIKELERLAPFGEENPEPVLAAMNLRLEEVKKVGKDAKHLKAWFERDGINLEAIGFGMGNREMIVGQNYDIAFNLQSNLFNGFEKAQLSLIDVKEAVQ